jgi:alpha-tubulin suppressor-like RCC1 family protein
VLTPQAVAGIANATAITAGTDYTCAVLADGSVSCWGTNRKGELGNGTAVTGSVRNFQPTPGKVKGLRAAAVAIGAGDNHTCALLATGGLQCWGNAASGKLTDGKDRDPFSYSTTAVP